MQRTFINRASLISAQDKMSCKEAFVTLVTTDSYVPGAIVLAQSLKSSSTNKRLICLVGPFVSAEQKGKLDELFELVPVEQIASKDWSKLSMIGRPELIHTLTKLHVWKLTFLEKAVFMDADMMVLKNIDDLFERDELSAVADVGWPDCFNSGLFVCRPSESTFIQLMQYADENGSFDGGDQGLLNSFFSNWSSGPSEKRIPFSYNMTFSAVYSYAPAYQHYKDKVKVIHFFGASKPWMMARDSNGNVINAGDKSQDQMSFYQQWWEFHDSAGKSSFAKKLPLHMKSNSVIFLTNGQLNHPTDSKEYYFHGKSNSGSKLDSEFVNYRIEWNAKVENHLRKNSKKKSVESPEDVKLMDQSLRMMKLKSPQ